MKYLLSMPDRVLFGPAQGIERWCKEHDKVRPTLADLDAARRVRRAQQ